MKVNYFDNVAIYSHGSISRQSDENLKEDKTFQNNNFEDLNSNSNKTFNQRVNDNNCDNKTGFFNSLKGKIITSLIIFLIIIIVTTIILIIIFKFKNNLDNSSSNIEINYSSESSNLSDENNNSKENSNMLINSIEENSNENIEQNSEKDFNDNSIENNKQSSEEINIDNSSSNEENEENKIKFLGKINSLTHANRLNYEILGTISRNFPKNSSTNEGLLLYPEYNVSSSFNGTDEEKEAILLENTLLIPSDSTFNEITKEGKLLLNSEDTGRQLYKHSTSNGLYYGDVDDNEQAVIKKISINPTEVLVNLNFITGLYAPAGEVIKIEISEEDLASIGGSLEVIIGLCTQTGGLNDIPITREFKRMPMVTSKFKISSTTGYFGSFFGGPIYISMPLKKKSFSVTITYAVQYRYFIYGYTSQNEFEAMDNFSAPYFDMEISHRSMRFSLPNKDIKNLDYENMKKICILWDKITQTSYQIPHGANDNYGIHFLFDTYIKMAGASAVAYVGANWSNVPTSWYIAIDYKYFTMYGGWGYIHELNHHFQKFGFSAKTSNEVTNNVINLVEYAMFTQISSLRNEFSTTNLLKSSGNHRYCNPVTSIKELNNLKEFTENFIAIYDPILNYFGYEKFIQSCKYGNGAGGIDIYYKSLSETFQYDFTYYFQKILFATVNNSLIENYQNQNYPIFIPLACIYQIGIYYTFEGKQYYSNNSRPYLIPDVDTPIILNFEENIVVPNNFTFTIKSIEYPQNGILTKIDNLKYSYQKSSNFNNSGIFKLTLTLSNEEENIIQDVSLALSLSVDLTFGKVTLYYYENVLYSNITEAYEANFDGYTYVNSFVYGKSYVTGISEKTGCIFEGKFIVEDNGYEYILYKGGVGSSFLMISINNTNDFKKVAEIAKNQIYYNYNSGCYEYSFKKGDIIYFKILLLTDEGSTNGNLYLALSKTTDKSTIKESFDIFNFNYDFNSKYSFYGEDYILFKRNLTNKLSVSFDNIKITSENLYLWSDEFGVENLIDNDDSTYMHTKSGLAINENNAFSLIYEFTDFQNFDTIYMYYTKQNYYLPKSMNLYFSDDGIKWDLIESYENLEKTSYLTLSLNKIYKTKFVKFYIKAAHSLYIAIMQINFFVEYIELNPEFPEYYGNVSIIYGNFATYGHGYKLGVGAYFKFEINCDSFIVKEIDVSSAEIEININNEINKEININENENPYQLQITGLKKGVQNIKIKIKKGTFNLDSILYK